MNAAEERIFELLRGTGRKSVRLADGRTVVVLDTFRDPLGPVDIHADFVQILPAGVLE
jgi:hypothetical protein